MILRIFQTWGFLILHPVFMIWDEILPSKFLQCSQLNYLTLCPFSSSSWDDPGPGEV